MESPMGSLSAPLFVTAVAQATVPVVATESDWNEYLNTLVAAGTLHPLEAALARGLPSARRATFVAGRTAMRDALRALPEFSHLASDAIRRTARGAPDLPHMVTGSITHKRTRAMAAVAPRMAGLQHVGLDLERRPTPEELSRPSVARKILTAREYAAVEQLHEDPLHQREQVLVHFALKEAVYKAIDPFVERYVRFTEVELHVAEPGEAHVTLLLPELANGETTVHARWHVEDEWIVAQAFSVQPHAVPTGAAE
ncbi:MAG: 4'-phosphopantetheinyl transferase superfamily protein [Gemmatimonadaceae bacterium]|nr:4'-phosphopantetheinyl transferase superfamily protein [Gemmatimonadaceae bacterium]